MVNENEITLLSQKQFKQQRQVACFTGLALTGCKGKWHEPKI